MKSKPAQTQVMNAKRDASLAQRRVHRRELAANAAERKSLEEKAKFKRARKVARQAKKAAKRALKEVAQAKLELEEAREKLRRAEKNASKVGPHREQEPSASAADRAKPFAQKKKTVPMGKKADPFLARRRGTTPLRSGVKRSHIRRAGKPASGSTKRQTLFEGTPERTETQPASQTATKLPAPSIVAVEKLESSRKPT